MNIDINLIKDIANLSLTTILAVSTVFLAIYTFRLVSEARKSRKAQVQPYISVHLEIAETDPCLQFVIVQNIGQGTAYNLTFNFQKDIGDYGHQGDKLAERGLFKQGMRFCPTGFTKKYFLLETKNDYAKKMTEEIIFEAKYQNIFNDTFNEKFHLSLKENKRSSKITPSDTFLGRISESLESIKKSLDRK